MKTHRALSSRLARQLPLSVTYVLAFASALGACRCGPKTGPVEKPAVSATTTTTPKSAPGPVPSETSAPMNRELECPRELVDARRDGTKASSYVEPTENERKALGEAVAKLAHDEDPSSAALDAIGFEAVKVATWPDVVLVREKSRRRGGGAYVLRRGSRSPLVVQAPHTFFDEGTFPLACELFQRSQARALFINTTHRYKSAPKTADGRHPADVAHSPTSLFQAATEALVDRDRGVSILQTHGFATREVDARAVVSSGERRGGDPWVAKAAKSLSEIMAGKVLRYPEDTNELGATTNVQGIVVRRAGGRFLHVEMDEAMRKRLLADAALRGRALDAMAAAIGAE